MAWLEPMFLGRLVSFLVKQMFRRKSRRQLCVRTFELFMKGSGPGETFKQLCADGFSKRNAARAVTFLPSAFARVYYKRQEIEFPSVFYPGAKAFRRGHLRRYSSEPIFGEAMRLAVQLNRDGDWSEVWSIIEKSADHQGIVKARSQGLTPTSVSAVIHEF